MTGYPRTPRRRTFGGTWWGKAWIDALEQRARLDPNRLPRGRTYARTDRVGPLRIEPGLVHAAVRGSRREPYSVNVRVRVLSDDEWSLVFDAVAGRAAHSAALLDGELPPEVVADALSAGVSLLPEAGEVGPRCSCPDWANPCKHAAAVVYLVADVLDTDPFALLLLRGRSREAVLGALRQRRSKGGKAGGAGVAVDPGVAARAAFGASLPPLPSVPLPPGGPGAPVPLAVDPPPESGLRRLGLQALAADAARRAWALCVGEGTPAVDARLDVIRRVADGLPADEMGARTGMAVRELAQLAAAWRVGGAAAVRVCDDSWTPPAGSVTLALQGVEEILGPVRMRANRITFGDEQFRVGRDGAWWRFERSGRAWELTRGPAAEPADLIG